MLEHMKTNSKSDTIDTAVRAIEHVLDNSIECFTREVLLFTRYKIVQTAPEAFKVVIPLVDGAPIIHPDFAKAFNLNDAEIERAEDAVIAATVIAAG